MFPKNKINVIYRLLCLISYLIVIVVINSPITLIVLLILFSGLGISERSFRNMELIIISIVIWGLCYLLHNYILLKIILIIDYCFYFLDTSYYGFEQEEEIVNTKNYLRFKKKKKKGSNNITAVYLTVHLVLLFVAIVVR